jgi:hypothetical protein
MSSGISMRTDNKGLTVKINLWVLNEYLHHFNSEKARLWIKGQVTNAETREATKFNDAGELISILGKWNSAKFKQLRTRAKNAAKNKAQ